ncbi:putative MFS family arabinose efflux permease [Hamadaea flava]|uniref:MFS transporter n=1 Tax=Hamadaea flava TaxID=1742688 RepID=A0ABV8M2Y1_9ACTN|nr:MFS transporter [Hamadaea flava]MCP2328623.1 putative MFS family arabinose efflux permease [Hamadaea flava]
MQFAPLRQRNFALLWWAGLISIAGDWTLRIALPIYVLQLTGSALATSGAVIAALIPTLLFGLVAGVYVDRWDRRTVLLVVSVLHGVTLLPLLAVDSAGGLWIVYAVLFIQSTLSQLFQPAENALLPNLVTAEHLPAANSLNTLNNNIARLAGPALGGLLTASLGLTGVVVVDAVSFLLSAALVAGIRGRFAVVRDADTPPLGVRRELAEGLRTAYSSPMLRALLGIVTAICVGEGIMGALFPVFVTGPLHGGARELGWTMSAQAIGGITGGLLSGRIAARIAPKQLLTWSLVVFGLIDLAIFNYPRWTGVMWPGLALFVIVGVPSVLSGVAWMTLLQGAVGDAYRGRIFSLMMVLQSLAALLGAGLAGTLAARLGVMNLLTVQGAVPVLCGIGFALISSRLGDRPYPAVVSPERQPVAEAS